jgi:hypothetical protein
MRQRFLAVLLLGMVSLPARAQTGEQRQQTVAYLHSLQKRGHAFVSQAGDTQPGLRATTAGARALKYFGGEVLDHDAAAKFVLGCFDRETGGFTNQPGVGTPDVATTAVGLMAVAELKMPVRRYAGPVKEFLGKHAKNFEEVRMAAAGLEVAGSLPGQADGWKKLLAEMRNPDGTYGKGAALVRDTGGAVAAQLRLGEKVKDPAPVLKALKAGQRPDGGFGKAGAKGSDLDTSYRVTRSFVMLGDRPDAARLRKFIASCRNRDGGYGVTPGERSSVSGTYYAGIILHWLAEK